MLDSTPLYRGFFRAASGTGVVIFYGVLCGSADSYCETVFGKLRRIIEMKSNGRGFFVRALLLAVAVFVALPAVALAQGNSRHGRNKDIFVNGHDARNGRYDRRDRRRDDDQYRRDRRNRDYDDDYYRRNN